MAGEKGVRALELLGYLAAVLVGVGGIILHYDIKGALKAVGPVVTLGLVLAIVVVVRLLAVAAARAAGRGAPSSARPIAEEREEVTR